MILVEERSAHQRLKAIEPLSAYRTCERMTGTGLCPVSSLGNTAAFLMPIALQQPCGGLSDDIFAVPRECARTARPKAPRYEASHARDIAA